MQTAIPAHFLVLVTKDTEVYCGYLLFHTLQRGTKEAITEQKVFFAVQSVFLLHLNALNNEERRLKVRREWNVYCCTKYLLFFCVPQRTYWTVFCYFFTYIDLHNVMTKSWQMLFCVLQMNTLTFQLPFWSPRHVLPIAFCILYFWNKIYKMQSSFFPLLA